MSQWKNIGAVVALSITAAFAGTGCLAQDADDDAAETEIAAMADEEIDAVADEKTGEADQAFGGFGGCGCGFSPWFGGCGLGFGGCWPCGGGFAGCGLGFAGLGCGLGWGAGCLPLWGGFGGCGCW